MIIENEADLYAEHQAKIEAENKAKEAAQQAEQAAREAKWAKDREEANKARVARERFFWNCLKNTLEEMGHRTELKEDGELFLTKFQGRWSVPIHKAVTMWGYPEKIEVEYRPDDYGRRNRKHYKQLKRGGFKYDEIAIQLISYAKRSVDIAVAQNQRENNKDEASMVSAELRLKQYSHLHVVASADPDKPVMVSFKFEQAMTAEAAIEIGQTIKRLGLLSEYDYYKDGEVIPEQKQD